MRKKFIKLEFTDMRLERCTGFDLQENFSFWFHFISIPLKYFTTNKLRLAAGN